MKQDESFLMVESKEFVRLVKVLNSQAVLFKADALKLKVMDAYAFELDKFKLIITAINTASVNFWPRFATLSKQS